MRPGRGWRGVKQIKQLVGPLSDMNELVMIDITLFITGITFLMIDIILNTDTFMRARF